MIDAPLVWLQPCPAYRFPVDGDYFTCETCGHFIDDHQSESD